MAATVITVTKLTRGATSAFPATSAVDATDGAKVDFSGLSDERVLLIIENAHASAAKAVTIVKGNGLQGVADFTESIAAGATKCIVIESMKYKNVSGTDKGKVVITGASADIKIAAVQLP